MSTHKWHLVGLQIPTNAQCTMQNVERRNNFVKKGKNVNDEHATKKKNNVYIKGKETFAGQILLMSTL